LFDSPPLIIEALDCSADATKIVHTPPIDNAFQYDCEEGYSVSDVTHDG
jgi:hypothetical protein